MQMSIKSEDNRLSTPAQPRSKKEKVGRWSAAEAYLFESLLERYGKNWRKIHQHMMNRSLSQIRSHAQKFFDKVGARKVQEYERRAKLLEAYETLEKEKLMRETPPTSESPSQPHQEEPVKQEESSPLTGDEEKAMNEPLPIIKEQGEVEMKMGEAQNYYGAGPLGLKPCFPFFEGINFMNGGYLLSIIHQNPEMFYRYQGIEGFVDNSAFRGYGPNQL